MTEEQELDPLMAFIMENPPSDAIEFRELLDGFAMMMNGDLPVIGDTIDDVVIQEFDGQDLTVDIHKPLGDGPFPILIYLHGGGWIMGSPKTHRRLGHRFAEEGYLVFNVHYRLGPEAPFPAAYDDCVTALDWVLEHAQEYAGDTSRIAMGGDSAGGNLTAAVAAHLEDKTLLKAILLIYPALDFANMDLGDGVIPGADINIVDLMVNGYIGHDYDNLVSDPRVSPIHVGDRLPPAHIMCGTADGLIEDCKRLEAILQKVGIDHETAYFDDMPHGFAQLEEVFPQARESIDKMIAFLNQRL